MCGIAGILHRDRDEAVPLGSLEKMIHVLRHRGPDGFGYHTEGGIGLAHARLSIIDLASGDQPIANEDKSIWTVFNGEIFNYRELRLDLEKAGHRFRTASDTETIVHAYEEYGDRFVDVLNGQFAIALWDRNRKRLLLARDRLGIRPLFYARDGGNILFASEIKSIQQVHSRGLSLDPVALGEVFTFWSPVGTRTAFQNVESLPPGHIVAFEAGSEKIWKYWDWSFSVGSNGRIPTRAEAAEEIESLLVDSIRLQLRSDVPVGAYLSGGLDSSGIVSLVRKHFSNDLKTFSIAFKEPEFDESSFQAGMVSYLGTDHTTVTCNQQDIGEHFPQFVWHAEMPVVRTAPVPLMLLSKAVREAGYKVVLTGEGADEVFGGYDLFKEGKIRRFWARNPESAWRPKLLSKLYPYLRHSPVGSHSFAAGFFGNGLQNTESIGYAHAARWSTTSRAWNLFSDDMKSSLLGIDVTAGLERDLPPEFKLWEGLGRDQYIEAKTLLVGYLLCSQGDRVAMANSVEGRVPFLDHRLVEFAGTLPARYKLQGLREKAILKRVLAKHLPTEIVSRVKQPYRAPDASSFFRNGVPLPYVEELLGASRIRDAGYFSPAAISRLFEKCRTGKAIGFGDNMALVGALSTMILHDRFVGKSA